jgi:hypothetical protein
MRLTALAFVLAALAQTAQAQRWVHELVDPEAADLGVRMRRDAHGVLFLCYTANSGCTRLAWQDSTWQFEDVPQTVSSSDCLLWLAFTEHGEPAVTYSSSEEAWLSIKADSGWVHSHIPYLPPSDWRLLPVAFDSLGQAVVPVVFDPYGGGWVKALGLARLVDSTWELTDTLTMGSHGPRYYVVGFGTKEDRTPWGVYVTYVYDIGYIYMSIGWFEWQNRWVHGTWFGSEMASVGPGCGNVDRGGGVHGAYRASDTSRSGFWFDSGRIRVDRPGRVALCFDSQGRPFIAFAGDSGMGFCYHDDRGWYFSDVGVSGVTWVDVAFGDSDQPLIAYQKSSGLCLARGENVTGVDEQEENRVGRDARSPGLARSTVRLEDGQSGALLDIAGRRVMGLVPGENDIRHLAPGIYFLRSAESGARSAVRKVVLTR